MPLLKKTPFTKCKQPEGLRDNDEVFHCVQTNEIFVDYAEFSERIILCNSMVWTCSITGKTGLTYTEALESEESARNLLKDFPNELKIPVLYLANRTKRTSFMDMADDVFMFMKDRYFIGENVEASFGGSKWREAHILHVIAPEDSKDTTPNGHAGERHFKFAANLYKYEVEQFDADDEDVSEVMIVDSDHIKRKKSSFTREKNKLFLKMNTEHGEDGLITINPSVLETYDINKLTFDQIFDGQPPEFPCSKTKPKKASPLNGKKGKQDTLSEFLSKHSPKPLTKNNLVDKMKKREEDFKRKKEMEEERNLRISKIFKDWNKPKEDLELEDHKILPTPIPVATQIPDEYVGDVMMILEFVHTFASFLSAKRFFPQGLTYELLERALLQQEVAGPLVDVLQMLLIGVFSAEEEETEQYKQNKLGTSGPKEIYQNPQFKQAIRFATAASKWSDQSQGMPINGLLLCPVTLTEILRLHLLSSGAQLKDARTRWRFQHRGGYRCEDDPGLHFRLNEPHILQALSLQNVTELPISDKLKILKCLTDQLLTYGDVRDLVEEQIENAKQAKLDAKHLQMSDRKSEQEYLAARLKIKRKTGDKTELGDELDKLLRDRLSIKGKNEKKIHQLMKKATVHVALIGQDRAFRRYLKLESVPGLFIEHEEEQPGYCFTEPIKQNPQLIGANRNQILDHIRKTCEEMSSDKENDPKEYANGSKVKETISSLYDNLMVCNADSNSCTVHSMHRQRWAFFNDPDKFEKFIACLNKRGVRENELQQILLSAQDYLEELIKKTPVMALNPNVDLLQDIKVVKTKNRYANASFGYPNDFSNSQILRETLTENILELEEKIHCGNLGGLKVKDREHWRNCLTSHDYDNLDKTLEVTDDETMEVENDSRPTTPELRITDPNKLLPVEINNVPHESVKSLALALIQVAQAIDRRYLKPPLGSAGLKKNNDRHDYLDRWITSLRCATSFSQVFLHCTTFNGCVLWSSSVIYAKCQVCKKRKDDNVMVLCELCNVGQHIYCFKPKLTAVPSGDWFCNKCQEEKGIEVEKVHNRPVRKTRKLFNYNDAEEEEEEEEEEELEEEVKDEQIVQPEEDLLDEDEEQVKTEEETNHNPLEENGVDNHSEGFQEEQLDDQDFDDEDYDDEMEESTSESDYKVSLDVCHQCKSGGQLIRCYKCYRMFHLECVRPPMRRIPRGQWACPKCRQSDVEFMFDGKVQRSGASQNHQRRCAARARNKIYSFAKTLGRTSPLSEEEDLHSDSDSPIGKRNSRSTEVRDDLPLHNAALQELLSEVLKHDDGWAFTRPVSKNEVPDYYDVIHKPMDFGTIKYKLNMGEYKCDAELMRDVTLVFDNCDTYNNSEAEVYKCGVRLLNFIVKRAKELGLKVPEEMERDEDGSSTKKRRLK